MILPRKRKGARHSADGLLGDLRRGGDGPATSAVERFPSAQAIASDPSLSFELGNKAGKIIVGVIAERMRAGSNGRGGVLTYSAEGGRLIGIGDDRHCVLIAPARSGKSRSHLIPTLLTYPADASVIVFDPKGDLASVCAKYRARIGQRVVLLDPFNAASSDVAAFRAGGFNVFSGVEPNDADAVVERAILVASALVTRSQRHETHWDDTAEEAIAGVCAHVMTSPLHAAQRHLGTVYRLLTRDTGQPEPGVPCDLEVEMSTNPAADGMVKAAAASLFEKSDRELASTLSTIRRHLSWLKLGPMRRSVETGDFDLNSIHTTPTALFVSLPVRHLSSCSGWQRMVLACLFASFEQSEERRAHQIQAGGNRALLIIDEMPASIGYFQPLEVAMGFAAGLGCRIYVCAQCLSQIQAAYPQSWATFLANSGTTTFIAPNEPTTMDWIQRRLGETTIVQQSQSEGSMRSLVEEGSSGRSLSLQTHPLMTGAEAARVLRREDPLARQLVISAAHGPMLLQRINYDQHPELMRRVQWAKEQ